MSGPDAGEFDSEALLGSAKCELDVELSAVSAGGNHWAAHLEGIERATKLYGYEHAHVATLLLGWLRGMRSNEETLKLAHTILQAASDPRRAAFLDMIDRIAAGTITWDQFARETKKGLIAKSDHVPPPDPGQHALALWRARKTLQSRIDDALVDDARSVGAVWETFLDFVQIPIRVRRGYAVDSDMCLSEWLPAGDSGQRWEWQLTRQLTIQDLEGNYEEMVHVQVSIEFGTERKTVLGTADQALWSGDDLGAWSLDVERSDLFQAARAAELGRFRVEQFTV